MRHLILFGIIFQVFSIQPRLFAQHDTLPAYPLEHSLYYKKLLLPRLVPSPFFRLDINNDIREPDNAPFVIKITDGPLRDSHGTATFMYILDSVGKVLSLKLLEIQIYSGPNILDWVIFTGRDQERNIHQGITFEQLQSIKMNEITKIAATMFFDVEQKYRRFELFELYKKEGSPYLKAENTQIIVSRYNRHLVPKEIRETN